VPPPEPHLVYDFSVDSLFKGLGARLTPSLKEKVRAAGIDLDKKLLPAYPKDVWIRAVDVVARELSVNGDAASSSRRLGHDITNGFAESLLGKTMAPGVRLMGVRRVMLRLPKMLTMSNNFLKVAVVESPGNSVRVIVNEAVPSAEFLCGIIDAIATYAGAKECSVTFAAEGPMTEFVVKWT
jgi:uncharacterized protein (TIGR02265 family)